MIVTGSVYLFVTFFYCGVNKDTVSGQLSIILCQIEFFSDALSHLYKAVGLLVSLTVHLLGYWFVTPLGKLRGKYKLPDRACH